MSPITLYRKQRQILDFISQYIQKNGYAPTLQEIAKAMNLSSLATVHEHLQSLVEKGLIKRKSGKVRAMDLTGAVNFSHEGFEAPILGFIAAGAPIEPYTDPNASMSIPSSFISGKKRTYVLQVRGESMIEEGIYDGDFVVLQHQDTANDGDIVVALLNNEFATLKKYYREKGRIRLQPANSSMDPIYVQPEELTIQGKVTGIIRKYN